jgi:hypothetical protein
MILNKNMVTHGARPLCAAVLASCALAGSAQAGSFTTEGGAEVRWTLGTSLGSSWRARNPDLDLVSVGNGGTAGAGNDNGDLNFHKNQAYSTVANVIGDVNVSRNGLGFFLRAKGWYDYTLENKGVPHGSYANGYVPGAKLNDADFDSLSKFSGAALLDAYVYGTFQLAPQHALNVRLGNQVVNWGESLFIPGINQYGAFDVTAAHRPGAQVKEILLPVPQLFASLEVAEGTSVEAFYQLAKKKTVLDGCGTYWSVSSVVNCSSVGTVVGTGPFSDQQQFNGLPALGGANFQMSLAPEKNAGSGGQFGLALRQHSELLDADLGLYYARYNARVPNLSAIQSPSTIPGSVWSANPPLGVHAAQALMDFGASKIQTAGLSMSTVVAGWSVFGEVSRTIGLPVQINGTDFLNGAVAGIGPVAYLAGTPAGGVATGYDRKSKDQAQISTLQVISRVLGAESVTLLAEAAYEHWSGIGDPATGTRYGRDFVFGSGPVAGIPCAALNPNASYCENRGYNTTNAWGWRMLVEANYSNVVAGINFKPRLFLSDDVKGYSADGNFNEGRRLIAPGLRLEYGGKYYADLSYSRYNHHAKYDDMHDRDLYSLVVGVNF